MSLLEDQLKALRESLSEMAKLVSLQLNKSIKALLDNDVDLANEVRHIENKVNAYELRIDKECEQIVTLLAPVAHDMRFVFSTLKINADLERVADYADGIAHLVGLGEKRFDPQLMIDLKLKEMSDIACKMMETASKAYCDDNAVLARTLFTTDKELNEINHQATNVIVEYFSKHPKDIHQALYLLSIIRKLERVGDHITNIAEDVIFYVEAKVLKHGDKVAGK